WLLVSAPVAASLLAALLTRPDAPPVSPRPSPAAAAVFALILAAVVLSVPGLEPYYPLLRSPERGRRTEGALEGVRACLLARRPAGRVFSRFEWGEYLTWSLSPGYTVFMDGRIEIYPDAVWDEYAAVTCGREGWQAVLDRYGVDCLLLDAGYH